MTRKLAFVLLYLGTFLATGVPLQAQTDPNLEQGLKPYGTFSGGEIDSISMTNGNLNLRIPLFSLPQRGKVHLGSSLFYTNKTYTPYTTCDALGNCTDYLDWYGNKTTQASGVAEGSDSYLAAKQTIIKSTKTTPTIYLYSELAPDGVSHPMAVLPSGPTRSIDATGILDSIDQNGIRYGSCAEDPNGNELCASDTLGRTTPLSSTTDYTGCTGSLAFSSAAIMSVTCPLAPRTRSYDTKTS